MNFRTTTLLLFSLTACAYQPALLKSGDDYRIAPAHEGAEQEPWGIAALPGGAVLSDDWTLAKAGGKSPQEFYLVYKQVREDGVLLFAAAPLAEADFQKTLPTLAERLLNLARLAARSMTLGNEQPLASFAVDGAEAQEAVYSVRRTGDYAPVRRTYLAVMKPFAAHQWFAVTFTSPPGQYESSVAEVRALVRRFHFDSTAVPKSPGQGAPAPVKKLDAPEPEPKPATPRYTPPGAALPG